MRAAVEWVGIAVIATAAGVGFISCGERDPVAASQGPSNVSAADVGIARSLGTADLASPALGREIGAQANSYPDSQVVNTTGTALYIHQTGPGGAAWFQAQEHVAGHFETGFRGTALATVFAVSRGTGHTIFAEKLASGGSAVRADNYSSGSAGSFRNLGSGIGVAALATGAGLALLADKVSESGGAASFSIQSSSNAANVVTATTSGLGRAGYFEVNNSGSFGEALRATSNGRGTTFFVQRTGTGAGTAATLQTTNFAATGPTLRVNSVSTGFAVDVNAVGPGGGLRVTTNGGPGLQVVGGAKNAVVGTSSGARALYSEESAEVWFTDYGFARLTSGRARVTLDRTFAETVTLADGYHVFVQSYGDAELVVRGRSASGFDVVRRDGHEDVEFSFRIVAKRKGFERERLARAPWADAEVRTVR